MWLFYCFKNLLRLGKAWKKGGDDSLQKILNENVCAVVQEFKI